MSLPLVSVITPSFNRASFIEDTIRSVSIQTYPHVEHIVIDGASSDDTVTILDAHARAGTLRYLSEPDSGMYDAINKGISMAKGDILCYLNTDDRYFPWSIETAVRHFEQNESTDIVYGDTIVIDLENRRTTINILPTFSSLWLRCGGIIPQPTVFLRRKVYTEVGNFQKGVKYLADCEYWLRADRKRLRIAKIHEVLALESNHSDTIRQRLSTAIDAEKRLLLERYAPLLFTNQWTSSLVNRFKYVEKEWLMAMFALENRLHGGLNGQRWAAFRKNYSIRMSTSHYYLDKMMRTKSNIWQLEEKHG